MYVSFMNLKNSLTLTHSRALSLLVLELLLCFDHNCILLFITVIISTSDNAPRPL